MKSVVFLLLITHVFYSCTDLKQSSETDNQTSANTKIIQRYFELFNAHNWREMAKMYIQEPVMMDPAYGIKTLKMSREQIVKKYEDLQKMIPDIHDQIVNMYHSGDKVIVEFKSSGSIQGNAFTLPICTIFELKNGKITKDLTYYDNME